MEGHTSLRPGEVAPLRGEGQEGDAHLFTNGRASRSQATRPVRGRCKSFNLTQPEFSLTAPDPTSGAAVCFSAHDGLKVARLPAMRALLPRLLAPLLLSAGVAGATPLTVEVRFDLRGALVNREAPSALTLHVPGGEPQPVRLRGPASATHPESFGLLLPVRLTLPAAPAGELQLRGALFVCGLRERVCRRAELNLPVPLTGSVARVTVTDADLAPPRRSLWPGR